MVRNVDVAMAPLTLYPSTSSRGSHPQTCSGSKWLWMAWLIVSSFLGFVSKFLCISNKSSKVASFGFSKRLSILDSFVDPFFCLSSVLWVVPVGVPQVYNSWGVHSIVKLNTMCNKKKVYFWHKASPKWVKTLSNFFMSRYTWYLLHSKNGNQIWWFVFLQNIPF